MNTGNAPQPYTYLWHHPNTQRERVMAPAPTAHATVCAFIQHGAFLSLVTGAGTMSNHVPPLASPESAIISNYARSSG